MRQGCWGQPASQPASKAGSSSKGPRDCEGVFSVDSRAMLEQGPDPVGVREQQLQAWPWVWVRGPGRLGTTCFSLSYFPVHCRSGPRSGRGPWKAGPCPLPAVAGLVSASSCHKSFLAPCWLLKPLLTHSHCPRPVPLLPLLSLSVMSQAPG